MLRRLFLKDTCPSTLRIETKRLLLLPYTIEICENILNDNYSFLTQLKLKKGNGWPDIDVLETIPRIISNLRKVTEPSGFESWMIIKKDNLEIIGDVGFKGYNFILQSADIGYGIITAERKKGYAEEATKALIDWAFDARDLQLITASCLKSNQGSTNLLKKLNFDNFDKDDNYLHWQLIRADL